MSEQPTRDAEGAAMSDQQTPLDLDPIKARIAQATAGPWIADDFCEVSGDVLRVGTTDGTDDYYQRTHTIAICEVYVGDEVEDGAPGLLGGEANARFIAHARTDLPLTVAEIERLREENTRLREALANSEVALRSAAEDVEKLFQRLYSRLNSGDIPWDAASDIQGEYGGDFEAVEDELKRKADFVKAALQPEAGRR